ncbi:fad-binding domain-containing protein [Diplodia corticola]|uniref:Fad-binding domain-containing protein n=1 Tax=Diplodia corticola TaxID=236234 RepID=A0A1J9RCP0_9PEZI|nr:fad-binding domain-containing protein [Diplodia corticola]OJD37898.1 fad-binding domain-containing protein [Diplodia corticola]
MLLRTTSSLLAALALAALPFSTAVPFSIGGNSSTASEACGQISSKISDASDVIHSLNPDFIPDIHHWYLSSSQVPECVFEPGSADDLATAMEIIASKKSSFAVESGGHASIPGFSSTDGVHISLKRMNQVVLSRDNATVELGFGLTWADVYEKLDGTGYNVVGGRVVGPGVGGFTLGGGFSWKTNQHGLTCDTVKSFTLVMPNGTVTRVDSETPDLFFALKGGLNRFGVVASAEFYTHPQPPQVYGGVVIYGDDHIDAVIDATAQFDADNTDPKAQIITTLRGEPTGVVSLVLFFYDGPERPAAFASFDKIDSVISHVKTQSFADFVKGFPANYLPQARGTFHTLSTSKLTSGFLSAVKNESDTLRKQMIDHSGFSVSYDIEPFLKTWGDNATESAYPHANSPLPLNLDFAWVSPDDDEFWHNAMRASVNHLKQVAQQEGIYSPDDFAAYPNYAIANTTAVELYGRKNAARLRSIRSQVDPDGVMDLAGGWSI